MNMTVKHYPLSYPVTTVHFDGKMVRRLPEERYRKSLEILKTLGISEVMLAGYVTVEEAEFDLSEETRRIGGLLSAMGMRPAQHHGISAVYAPLAASQEPVVERLIRQVEYTANLHSPILVIHPGSYYEPDSWKRRVGVAEFFERETAMYGTEAVLSVAAGNLHEAGRAAEKLGVKIALENVDRFEPMGGADLLPRLVERADSPGVGFCLDAGHAHCCGRTSVTEWIALMGDKLFTTHFHDNRGVRLQALGQERWISPVGIDEHLAPGFGTIPWLDVIGKLRETGYKNTVNFESRGWPGMPEREGFAHAIAFWRALERGEEEKL